MGWRKKEPASLVECLAECLTVLLYSSIKLYLLSSIFAWKLSTKLKLPYEFYISPTIW
jgi:hypothetical protein